MCLGIAEIDQEPIPKQLSDMPIKALDDLGTDPLVCTDHVTPVFRVELAGEFGRIDQVAEHHGELTAFRVGGMRGSWWRFGLGRLLWLYGQLS
jgi:hypothetical protein